MIRPEDHVVEWFTRTPAVDLHVFRLFGNLPDGRHAYGPTGPERDKNMAAYVRREALGMMASALFEGYDGSELAPKPRNADEHRVAKVHVGSGLLRDIGPQLTAVDWDEARRLCQLEADARAQREAA